jgi:hypothetical protein
MSLSTSDHAYLAKNSYEDLSREVAVEGERIPIGKREYEVIASVSKPSGYQGTAYRDVVSGEVIIANRGTEFDKELLRDLVLSDGGMVAKSVNIQADDALAFAREVIELTKERAKELGESLAPITSVGHSLGGSLSQIQSHHLGLKAETYNAFGAAELTIMQGPAAAGAHVINHMNAADFVSAASRHFGEVRVYATEADIAHLKQNGYGRGPLIPNVPMPMAAAAVAGRINAMADAIAGPSPVSTAISGYGIGAHRMATMAPDRLSDPSVLSDENRQRYEANRALVDAYRTDLREIRMGISEHAKEWPRAVDAVGWSVRRASETMEAAGVAHAAMNLMRDTPRLLGQAAAHRIEDFMREGAEQAAAHPSSYLHAKVGLPPSVAQAVPQASAPRAFSDPHHPQHALYNDLKSRLPAHISEDRLAQITAASHCGRVQAGRIDKLHVSESSLLVEGKLTGFANVDLTTPPPTQQHSLQQAQAYTQEQMERHQQLQQQRELQQEQHGPRMTLH